MNQDELDEYIRQGIAAPAAQPGRAPARADLSDDAQRQAYLDQLTARLLEQLQLNVPSPEYAGSPGPGVDDPMAEQWPATGVPRMRR